MSFLIAKDEKEYKRNKRTARHITFAFIGLCMIYLGMISLFHVIPDLILQYDSYSWKTLPGKIIESKVERRTHRYQRGSGFKKKTVIRKNFRLHVMYEFIHLNGLSCGSERFYLGSGVGFGSFETEDEANEAIKQYPIGKEVTVYVNAKDHDEFCVYPGIATTTVVLLLLSSLSVGVGGLIVYLVYYFRYKKNAIKGDE